MLCSLLCIVFDCTLSTLCLRKKCRLMFVNNFANVDRCSQFFHQLICKKILYVYIAEIFTSHAVRCYALPSESRKCLCFIYIYNFLTNHAVHICQS